MLQGIVQDYIRQIGERAQHKLDDQGPWHCEQRGPGTALSPQHFPKQDSRLFSALSSGDAGQD